MLRYHLLSAFIAQVVERIIGNDEVTGSTPVESWLMKTVDPYI